MCPGLACCEMSVVHASPHGLPVCPWVFQDSEAFPVYLAVFKAASTAVVESETYCSVMELEE